MLTRHGWMIIYHGVHEVDLPGGPKHPLCYSAGVMVLSKNQPNFVRYRSAEPVLAPLLHEECHGIVPNVGKPLTSTHEVAGDRPGVVLAFSSQAAWAGDCFGTGLMNAA